jgi:hypothetical protein
MIEDNSTGDPVTPLTEEQVSPPEISLPPQKAQGIEQIWEGLVRLGLGETAMRVGTSVVSIALFLVVIWVMSNFYLQAAHPDVPSDAAIAAALPTATATVAPPAFIAPVSQAAYAPGITRLADVHTYVPSRPRFDVVKYTVKPGDNLMSIATMFNLKPETILWGNYDLLADNPDSLRPGQELNILPVDGVYYQWHAGDGLNGVAKFYGVSPDEIIDWPGNHLDRSTLGDLTSPNITPGTWLMIPGGHRQFVTWSAPMITRANPGVAKIMGPGFCGTVPDGAVGTQTFIWPTNLHYLSGYAFSPSTNHWGIDVAGQLGDAVFASDNGVVVYAGETTLGYGNVVVIDHGDGWQTLYAHLSQINVACGASVYQGNVIGLVGSTGNSSGPHLHFEMMNDKLGRVNPQDYLH